MSQTVSGPNAGRGLRREEIETGRIENEDCSDGDGYLTRARTDDAADSGDG